MKLTALGSMGAYPENNCGTSCYYVESDVKLFFDFGSNVLGKLDKITTVDDIDSIFITHFHSDHIADLLVLRYHKFYNGGGVTKVYMPKVDCPECEIIANSPCFDVTFVNVGDVCKIGLTEVEVMSAFHSVECVGYKIKDGNDRVLYYTGDTVLCDEIYQNAKGSNVILCDCFMASCEIKKNAPHMSAKDGLTLASSACAKLIGTHVYPRCNLAVENEIYPHKIIKELISYEI